MQRAIRILICRAGTVRLDRLSTWGARLGIRRPGQRGKAIGPLRRVRDDVLTGRRVSDNGRLQRLPKYGFASGGLWVRDMLHGGTVDASSAKSVSALRGECDKSTSCPDT